MTIKFQKIRQFECILRLKMSKMSIENKNLSGIEFTIQFLLLKLYEIYIPRTWVFNVSPKSLFG